MKNQLEGLVFGRLTVIEDTEKRTKSGKVIWLCGCSCGNTSEVISSNLTCGSTKSCGCLNVDSNKTHGLSRTKVYEIYNSMMSRCYNKKNKHYNDYGGRGIAVCQHWKNNPSKFANWCYSNGYSDNCGLQLDREDNQRGYAPYNCRFISARNNTLNQRLIKSDNKTGFNGVAKYRNGKFISYITVKGNRVKFGYFNNAKDACVKRDKYIIKNNLQHEYKLQVIK